MAQVSPVGAGITGQWIFPLVTRKRVVLSERSDLPSQGHLIKVRFHAPLSELLLCEKAGQSPLLIFSLQKFRLLSSLSRCLSQLDLKNYTKGKK